MKEKNNILDILRLEKLIDHLSKFLELKIEIYELKAKEQLVEIISSFATLSLIVSFGMFLLFFCSLGLGFYLNTIFDSTFIGFLIVGIFYLIICLALIVFKDKIITNSLFHAFFSETITGKENEQDSQEQDEN